MKKSILALLITTACILQTLVFIPAYAADIDPYAGFDAVLFDDKKTSQSNFNTVNGWVGAVWAGDWICYKDVDFGEIAPYMIEVGIGVPEGYATQFQLRADDPNGPIVAKVDIEPSGGWGTPAACKGSMITELTGKHDIYWTFDYRTANVFTIKFHKFESGGEVYQEYSGSGAFPDLENEACKDQATTLFQLGIIERGKDPNLYPKKRVLRGEFAQSLYKFFSTDKAGQGSVKTKFVDVTPDSDYSAAIQYLSDAGIMNGASETKFEPYRYIENAEAITAVVRALGFSTIAESQGGYPAGYLAVANREGLLPQQGFELDDVLTRENWVYLLHNAIESDYYSLSSVSSKNYGDYERKTGILSEIRKIYHGTGTITETPFSRLTMPGSELPNGEILIDDTVYNVGTTQASSMLGFDCSFYYTEEDGVRTIKNILPQSSNEVIKLSSENADIYEITDSEIVYCENGSDNEKTIKIDSNTNVFYNDVAVDDLLTTLIDNENDFRGTVKIIKKPKGKVIFIEEYRDYIVQTVDTMKDTVFASNSEDVIKTASEQDAIFVYNSEGVITDIGEIGYEDVLTVYRSKNKSGKMISRIYISKQTQEGSVTEINNEGILVDNVKTAISVSCTENFILGEKYEFFLNAYGEIVGSASLENRFQTGMFFKHIYKNENFSETVYIRMLASDGTIQIYPVSSVSTIDGLKITSVEQLINGVSGWGGIASLNEKTPIRYWLSSDGKIRKMDTLLTGTNDYGDTLKLISDPSQSYRYDYTSQIFSQASDGQMKFYFDAGSELFKVRDDEERCLKTVIKGKLKDNDRVDYDLYSYCGDDNFVDIVVWDDPTSGDEWESIAVVEEKIFIMDDDGEVYDVLVCLQNGKKVEYLLTDEVMEVEKVQEIISKAETGDVLIFKKDYLDNIYDCEIVALKDGGVSRPNISYRPLINNTDTGAYGDANLDPRYLMGEVKSINDKYMIVKTCTSTELISFLGARFYGLYNQQGRDIIQTELARQNIAVGNHVVVYVENGDVKDIYINSGFKKDGGESGE